MENDSDYLSLINAYKTNFRTYNSLVRSYRCIIPIDFSEWSDFVEKTKDYCSLHAFGGGLGKWFSFRSPDKKLFIVYKSLNGIYTFIEKESIDAFKLSI